MLTYVDDDASNNEANKADNISQEVPNSPSFTSNSRSSSSSIKESSKYRLDTVYRNNQYVKNIEDFAGCYSKMAPRLQFARAPKCFIPDWIYIDYKKIEQNISFNVVYTSFHVLTPF